MSLSLPDIDLTGVTVGQSGFLSFQNAGVSADPSFTKNMPKLRFHNESGSGLRITFQLSGDTFTLPAGAWKTQVLIPGESGYSWQVLYNLPNPPVTTLFSDYYYPNEPIPEGGVLGNSPIGIGGTIAVTNVSSLSNETTVVKTLIIDIGLVGNTLLYQLFSDGSATWSVINGGVAHTVIQVNNAGIPLQLGKTGDTTEVLGTLAIDQNLTVAGASGIIASAGPIQTTGASQNIQASGQLNSVQGIIALASKVTFDYSGADLTINTPTGNGVVKANGTNEFFWNSTGLNITNKIVMNNNGTLAGISAFAGGGSGTFNHGFGRTPAFCIPVVDVVGSATMGYSAVTSTQVTITVGAVLAFKCYCID